MAAPDPAVLCLDQVALEAGTRVQQSISRVQPRDAALAWKTASIHPLQALETEYQGIVHDAVHGIKDPDTRKPIESEALGDFFFFDSATPRLLGVQPGEGYNGDAFPMLEGKLLEASRQIKIASALLKPPANQQVEAPPLRIALQAAYDQLVAVRAAFVTLPGSDQWGVAPIANATAELTGVKPAIATLNTVTEAKAVIKHLKAAASQLKKAVAGLATVQMFYVIEPFYLFRLLVRYRIESDRAISPGTIAECSGVLTDLVTNGHPWLNDWLRDKVVDLAARIAVADPSGNTLFFLKGGRAIQYLQGTPASGKNDWDTQIVINPTLPPAIWYDLFLTVSNAVLLALQDYKAEFYMLLEHRAADFANELAATAQRMDVDPQPAVAPDDDLFDPMEIDDPDDPMGVEDPPPGAADAHQANCKAELIDVGLPRYDTVEALEQWEQLRTNILVAADGMPYPGYLYYIGEYVAILREVFAGVSPSQRKAPVRVERLYKILELGPVTGIIQQVRATITPQLLPLSVAAVDSIPNGPTRDALLFLLQQFSEGYNLAIDPGLAVAFDQVFVTNLPNAHQLAPYSQAFSEAIAALVQAGKWDPGYGTLADAIGFCQWISQGFEAHFVQRAAMLLAPPQSTQIDSFLRTMFNEGIFSPTEELEVQLAIDGSYGAFLQGQYLQYPRSGDLDPVTWVGLGISSPLPTASPATMLELVSPLVDSWLQDNPGVFTVTTDAAANAIRLYWAQPQVIPPFTQGYTPLAVEIVARPPPERPLLSYIWGLGTLGLRELILQYRGLAAHIEEFGRRAKLRETAAAVTEMLTRASNPEPINPAITELQSSSAHHLMISTDSLAVGPRGAYPASYYQQPYMAYEVTITANRPALRDTLTLGPVSTPRTLDLLVLNRDHGDIGQFAGWSATDLTTYLVQPLLGSGVTANFLLLDFCVSASLLPVFAPLCAPGGLIVSNLYSITSVIMTTEFWQKIKPALQQRDLNSLWQAIQTKMRYISADVTGLSHLENVRSPATSEQQIANHLALYPNDRDAISIIRYLPMIAGALADPGMALAQSFAELDYVRSLVNLGYQDRAVIAPLPGGAGAYTGAVRTEITGRFNDRVNQILTQPTYGLGYTSAPNRLFGDGSRWNIIIDQRGWLLALAAGLTRCPTPLCLFDSSSNSLMLDAALTAQPIAPRTRELLETIDNGATADVVQILNQIAGNPVATFRPTNNYLQ